MTKHEFMWYVKNHKKEIALGALCTIGAGVLIALGVKAIQDAKAIEANPVKMIGDIVDDNWEDRNVVEGFTTGKVNELWDEGSCKNAIVNFFTIKDMGKLGEDLKKIEGVTDDTEVTALLGFLDTNVEN